MFIVTEYAALTVGFLLLRYSVVHVCTAYSLSLYVLFIHYLCFISFLYLGLFVLGDDSLIIEGFFMRTNHLCVRIKGEVDSLSPRVIFLPTASFVDLF